MPAGEIQLVAYGVENMFLNDNPQITFFKIIYRRYTNFSIETVRTDFLYPARFNKKFTCELSKIGDLISNMWLVLELPDIPIVYNSTNNIDNKIKFKWAKKIAYALIDYVEITIGGYVIERQWGEWMNVLNEINFNNFQGSLDQYIGNIPELTEYKYVNSGIGSNVLYIPMFFWFCKNSGLALPILCLEYNNIKFNIQFKNFENCGIYSPSNYIRVQKYYGNSILGEPLMQLSSQGIAWAEFDSIDIANYDKNTLKITNYNLYYRKISDNSFITTTQDYYDNFIKSNNLKLFQTPDVIKNNVNFFIYGLYSGAIYVPESSDINNYKSIYIENNYAFTKLSILDFKNIYLLCDYIYLDRDERLKFYENKHDYIIEQVYFNNDFHLQNINNKNTIEVINPCKYIIFMGQISYLSNINVNDTFNYTNVFYDTNKTFFQDKYFINKNPVIKSANIALNSSIVSDPLEMEYYQLYNTYNYYTMAHIPNGFGIESFSLYPAKIQPSGSCNLSCFTKFDINTQFNIIDINYNNYIFKTYAVTYNVLRIANGVCGTIFNSNY